MRDALPTEFVRSHTTNSRLRDHLRPPVVYGGLLQAAVLGGFVAAGFEMQPRIFAVGMVGPALAALLTAPDAGWVDAPLSGVFGGCLYLLGVLAYGAYVASGYEYVLATWVFGEYISLALTQAVMLLPAFVFFGLIVGGVVGWLKAARRRRRQRRE
ncbi:MAG: hypothetical protein V5A46_00505 [Haloferacaceae archaeon]